MAKRTCANSVKWMRLFPLPGWFGFTLDEGAFARTFKRFGAVGEFPEGDAKASATPLSPQDGGDMVFIVAYNRAAAREAGICAAQEAALLAHEAVHVWDQLQAWLEIGRAATELSAYTIQGFTQAMLEWLELANAEGGKE